MSGKNTHLKLEEREQIAVCRLDGLSQSELLDIVMSHNLTPRKCLGYLTPVQALLKDLGKDVRIRFA